MAKRTTKKASTSDWTAMLDSKAVKEAMEEATVDANGVDEQPDFSNRNFLAMDPQVCHGRLAFAALA